MASSQEFFTPQPLTGDNSLLCHNLGENVLQEGPCRAEGSVLLLHKQVIAKG